MSGKAPDLIPVRVDLADGLVVTPGVDVPRIIDGDAEDAVAMSGKAPDLLDARPIAEIFFTTPAGCHEVRGVGQDDAVAGGFGKGGPTQGQCQAGQQKPEGGGEGEGLGTHNGNPFRGDQKGRLPGTSGMLCSDPMVKGSGSPPCARNRPSIH